MRIASFFVATIIPLGRIFLFFSLLFFPQTSIAKFVPNIQIEHSPPTTSLARGKRISLKARIIVPTMLNEARCYFKYETDKPYLFVEMNQTGQEFECQLPVPASHINKIEYIFVAVDSLSHVVKTRVFQASFNDVSEDQVLPSEKMQSAISVKSDTPISTSISGEFAPTDQPIFSVAPSDKRYGLRVALYDLSQNPDYGYSFFGGFEINDNNKEISPVRGFIDFSRAVSSDDNVLSGEKVITGSYPDQNYPDIAGSDWSGYFYVVDNHGNVLSSKISVTASVYHDGRGNVSIRIANHRCPGRSNFSNGRMDTSGYALIYDDCDGEIWSTHWHTFTSTSIQIMDFIDPPYYKKLNAIDLTRPDPHPLPEAPSLISPKEGDITDFRVTLLEWNAANYAVKYQIQRGSSCDAGSVYETSSLSYILYDIQDSSLDYWKVRGENSVGMWGPWSSCWSFVTKPHCPTCPVINSLLLNE